MHALFALDEPFSVEATCHDGTAQDPYPGPKTLSRTERPIVKLWELITGVLLAVITIVGPIFDLLIKLIPAWPMHGVR